MISTQIHNPSAQEAEAESLPWVQCFWRTDLQKWTKVVNNQEWGNRVLGKWVWLLKITKKDPWLMDLGYLCIGVQFTINSRTSTVQTAGLRVVFQFRYTVFMNTSWWLVLSSPWQSFLVGALLLLLYLLRTMYNSTPFLCCEHQSLIWLCVCPFPIFSSPYLPPQSLVATVLHFGGSHLAPRWKRTCSSLLLLLFLVLFDVMIPNLCRTQQFWNMLLLIGH